MMLYKLVNGTPVAPPRNGVSADGRAISNFSGRVLHDAAVAKANGYQHKVALEEIEASAANEAEKVREKVSVTPKNEETDEILEP